MPTPKALALRALDRTTNCLRGSLARFPTAGWRDSPGGKANSLHGVVGHLYECEHWWRENVGIAERESLEQARRRVASCECAEQLLALWNAARDHLLESLAAMPDRFFEDRVPRCQYGGLHSGAELCLYMGEHDFYHDGQIQMLEMAVDSEGGRDG